MEVKRGIYSSRKFYDLGIVRVTIGYRYKLEKKRLIEKEVII
ncbi:hypothetical protein SAMN02745196_02972 [Clostridium collagenovorans DSM 3089]|uniref:Uncharacterized protein n=1 Tax=Clostridium collagenovorans DSM 3089 TaxID=1121306 RepID=A0A1M5YI78_9CLOT|nr:hypothetical protein [Clostridium collagenovorans]SHI11730.1 hypothetical protein SAMN02745196_02972 [Clostridium collagenovorans DSM 3089]